jgi:protein-L-isoaspartate(D-aspartate) O-methyltransferase
MAQALTLNGSEKVLDVGTGSGYHAAVLGRLAMRVISVERIPKLVALARANLERAGCGQNITVVYGDGSLGYPREAPYDAISVAAGSPEVPRALLDQLRDPGRLVIPVGNRFNQDLYFVQKKNGQILTKTLTGCRFVPLVGHQGW